MTALFAGLFFAYMPAYLTAVAKYDAVDSGFCPDVWVVLHAALIVAPDGWRPAIRHISSPGGRDRAGVGAYPFYAALARRRRTSPADDDRRVDRRIRQRHVRLRHRGSVSDAHPLQRRGRGAEHQPDRFGGMAPLVATALIRNLQSPVAPALVVIACGVVRSSGAFGRLAMLAEFKAPGDRSK